MHVTGALRVIWGYTSPHLPWNHPTMNRLLLFCIPALALLTPLSADAKDLRGRFGGGFNNQFGHVSALSVRYALPTPDPVINVRLEGNFGLDSAGETGGSVFSGGRLLYGVIAEDNMSVFASGGLGVLTSGENSTLRAQPSMGADFFLFGLENLGFTVEWGLNLDLSGNPGVATTAAMAAGAHYWF